MDDYWLSGELVAKEAHRWLGTPFHHQAALLGVGCDCFGVVRGIYGALTGLFPPIPVAYSVDWFKGEGNRAALVSACSAFSEDVSGTPILLGDCIVFKNNRGQVLHVSIFVGDGLIHALGDPAVQKVIKVEYSDTWRQRYHSHHRLLAAPKEVTSEWLHLS